MAKNYRLNVDQQLREVALEELGDGRFSARVGDIEHEVALHPLETNQLFRLSIDGERTPLAIRRDGNALDLFIGADRYSIEIERAAVGALGAASPALEGDVRLTAPMTGQVTEVIVADGDAVQENDPLLVIVAMKMNNEIRAPVAGTIAELRVGADTAVEQGDLLLVIQAARTGDAE